MQLLLGLYMQISITVSSHHGSQHQEIISRFYRLDGPDSIGASLFGLCDFRVRDMYDTAPLTIALRNHSGGSDTAPREK